MILSVKASALIIALTMILVLSVVTLSLLSFVSFYYLDAVRLYETEKLKLISEKEVLETIKLAEGGAITTNVLVKTNTDNFVYRVYREVYSTNNVHSVVLRLESQRAAVRRNISFFVLMPTDFCYVQLSKLFVPDGTKCVFWGYSFLRRIEGNSPDTFFAFYVPPLFSDNTNLVVKSYMASAKVSPDTPSLDLKIFHPTNVVNAVSFRVSVDEIVKKAESMVDKEWVIRKYSGEVEEFLNPIISEKTFLGTFSYANPKIRVNLRNIDNIYFSEKRSSRVSLENSDAYGSRGEVARKFVSVENSFLSFVTLPVEVTLPPEAFSEPFRIKLNLKHFKTVSEYRKVVGVFLDNTNENLQNNGVILKGDTIEMVSEEVRGRYYVKIGRGDGKQNRFRISREINPQRVFVGGKEAKGFFVENFHVVFSTPPGDGEEVVVMKAVPRVFIQKSLPPNGIHVFSDKVERAVVLDFDKIQNLPKNGIIFSHLPLVIRGSPNEPVAVVSRENVYIDMINTTQNPRTILIVSGKGVFLKEFVEVLRNVVVVSKLDGLYRLSSARTDDISNERSKWVFGTVILTGELVNGVLHPLPDAYVSSYENPINNSTFSISERVARDYISQSEFGRSVRALIPPMVVVGKVK